MALTPEQQLLDKSLRQIELVGDEVVKAMQQAINGIVVARGMIARLRQTYGIDDEDAEHGGGA